MQWEELKKMKELLDMGVITQEEFDEKKKELLNKSSLWTNLLQKCTAFSVVLKLTVSTTKIVHTEGMCFFCACNSKGLEPIEGTKEHPRATFKDDELWS